MLTGIYIRSVMGALQVLHSIVTNCLINTLLLLLLLFYLISCYGTVDYLFFEKLLQSPSGLIDALHLINFFFNVIPTKTTYTCTIPYRAISIERTITTQRGTQLQLRQNDFNLTPFSRLAEALNFGHQPTQDEIEYFKIKCILIIQ